jgi:UPF0716 protein FxsA
MHPVKMVAIALLAWPMAEIAAFIFVASLVGISTALLLLVLVSFAGVLVLRQFGGAVRRRRAAAGHVKLAGMTLDGTGMATSLGGILLVIPGFITGLLGILVMFPTSRRWLSIGCRHLFSGGRRPASPEIVDLAPNEWQALPDAKLPYPGVDRKIEPTALP